MGNKTTILAVFLGAIGIAVPGVAYFEGTCDDGRAVAVGGGYRAAESAAINGRLQVLTEDA